MKENGLISYEDLLSTFIHELRDPLAPVRASLQILDAHHKHEQPSPFVHHQTEVIKRQVSWITDVISDGADLMAAQQGTLRIKADNVEICSLVRNAVEEIRPIAHGRRIFITAAYPPEKVWVKGDKDRLTQAFGRLFYAIIRTTESNDSVSLTVSPSDSQVVVNVQAAKPSSPGVGADWNLKSLGFGFLLAQQIISLHGGVIERTFKNMDQGVEVSTSLPVCETAQKAVDFTREERPERPRKTKKNILVVDDHPDTVESLAIMVRLLGHKVTKCHSGITAVEEALKERPDVVILDIGMPGYDGYKTAEKIKEEFCDNVKFLAMTGYGEEKDKQMIRQAGFHRHLIKPVALEDLEEALTCVNE